MKNLFLFLLAILFYSFSAYSQQGNTVLIETFTETGCGACAQYDSSFQAIVKSKEDKVVVINYHCFYKGDSLYQYNTLCDQKYSEYGIKGFPGAMINGTMPDPTSNHMAYITPALIDKHYNAEKQFEFEITAKPVTKGGKHAANIEIKTKSLKDFSDSDLKLYIVITENNIDYEKRFNTKSTNGLNHFDNIMRAYLPDSSGIPVKEKKAGKINSVKISYTNDDKNVDYKEVQIIAFVRDVSTGKVLGVAKKKENIFQ